jgi:hypothetical protein
MNFFPATFPALTLSTTTPGPSPDMLLTIRTIPHSDQRYDTAGDWQWAGFAGANVLTVKVNRLPDWRYELLVGLHEAIEAALFRQAGISQESIDRFDMAHSDADEPGDIPAAPYHKQYAFASLVMSA